MTESTPHHMLAVQAEAAHGSDAEFERHRAEVAARLHERDVARQREKHKFHASNEATVQAEARAAGVREAEARAAEARERERW